MDKETVDKINRSSMKLSMVVTGGGSQFIGDFLSFSGGSNTILDFQVPYSQEAHENYIGMKIGYKYVSEEAAFQLAKAAFAKMEAYVLPDDLLGVGVTASLTKDNEREGRKNHFYVGIADKRHVYVYHIEIDTQELNWREGQEKFVSEMILNILNDREGLTHKKFLKYEPAHSNLPKRINLKEPVSFFSGSFNPMHDGHKGIIDEQKERYGEVVLELSTCNRDKAEVSWYRLAARVYDLGYPYIITRYPLIVDKIDYYRTLGFENINIVMGTDTWKRFIADSTVTLEILNSVAIQTEDVKFCVYNRGEDWSNATRRNFRKYGLDVEFIDYDVNLSSTEIREKLALTKGQNNA